MKNIALTSPTKVGGSYTWNHFRVMIILKLRVQCKLKRLTMTGISTIWYMMTLAISPPNLGGKIWYIVCNANVFITTIILLCRGQSDLCADRPMYVYVSLYAFHLCSILVTCLRPLFSFFYLDPARRTRISRTTGINIYIIYKSGNRGRKNGTMD